MARVYHETEHQELFYLKTDLHQPLSLHVPSALGPLAYYVCLKVTPAQAKLLDQVRVHAKLTGLRNTDRGAVAGEGVAEPRSYRAPGGKVWFLLCRLPMARGDGTFEFFDVPAELQTADILFCTWLRFIESGDADAWIAGQADPAWAPSGVPLGGIGAGRVDICRDGRFRNFSGNNNQDMPLEDTDGLAGAFLSVRSGKTEHALSTRPVNDIPACRHLTFEAAFPQAVLSAPRIFSGLDVEVRFSAPFVPQDLKHASLPAVLLRWHVHNRTANDKSVTCRFAWPNLVGFGGGLGEAERRTGYGDGYYRHWQAENKPVAKAVFSDQICALRYTNAPSTVCASADGAHIVAVRSGGNTQIQTDARRGSVCATLNVPADGEATLDMTLVWEMPHWIDSLGTDRGMYWQNHFTDGLAIAEHVLANFQSIFDGAGELGQLMQRTALPAWMWRRLLNCCYPLVVNSVLYKDGRFSINEGPTEMSGVYGTIDQRLGSHAATQLLFPQLNRQELNEFAAVMCENGEVNHDLGSGHLERGPAGQKWPDILCSFAIQEARHAWSTGDAEFAKAAWPKVKRALERHALWAAEGGGVAQLGHTTGLGTSYDSYHYEGTTAYIGTLWIAAAQIGKKWALSVDDHAFAALADGWVAAAQQRLDADLWNGRFYRAYHNTREHAINENCHGGTLAGEYYARMLAGTDVLSPERLSANCEANMALQGSVKFAVPPDEVAPDGSVGSLYGWLPYIESFCVAPAAILGHPKALAVWERMVRCMQGNDKHPCDTRLMYRPQGGEQSWGAYYMTAPASWLVYDALLDFFYTPGTGVLRLLPQLQGCAVVVHPLFWGVVQREGAETRLTIHKVFGSKPLLVQTLESQATLLAAADGRDLTCTGAAGVYRTFRLPAPVELQAGSELMWITR